MHKEILGTTEKERTVIFIGVLVAAFVLWMITGALRAVFPFSEVICFVIFGAITFLLVYKGIREYRYTLDENTLYIERCMGKKVTLTAGLDVREAHFAPYSNQKDIKPAFFTTKGKAAGAYSLKFESNGKAECIVIHPSKELINLIEEAKQNGAAEEKA